MPRHEQAVIDVFNAFMRTEARNRSRNFRHIALDGQDRHVLADYILTNESTFTLVEFKYTLSQLPDEEKKRKVSLLCKELVRDGAMRARHDLCHFIAWMQLPARRANLNVYRHEICNCEILGRDCGLETESPSATSRLSAVEFARSFFEEPAARTLSIDEFEVYVEWLCSLGGSSASQLELLVGDEDSGDCDFIEFGSLRLLYEWFQGRRRTMRPSPPTPSCGPGW
ncbi:Uncharacterised protein [Burkholderia pseudomallei]|uniref:hypothetical protein n=1 Tax=Burkholderia pseudomallei TaxID=28450 RepID=UPI000F13CDE8|nr:hypothetical protein [Burkholderia pseudomallei]CAJ7234592.1 Uncharacterised protein [Burkholderia pseudomallei]VBC15608.1 Uncharacterised protein [Burkholderia pseudomallei]VBS98920.1 Uncharacterised protein [Burkholderia pseudomallei]